MKRIWLMAALWPLILTCTVRSQEGSGVGTRLMQDPAVRAALDAAKQNEPKTLEYQIHLSEIPAPPFKEERRAEAFKRMFQDLGLRNVRIDEEGNVLGERPGTSPRPHVVMSAHLDTVFAEGIDVKTSREGAIIKGPGIVDDSRGLAVILGVVQALDQAQVKTPGTITFIGTVGEEGLGDLRGVKHLFRESLKDKIDKFISIDGSGLGITHIGVGSHRYRIIYKGPGGHSFGAFGLVNPIHALGRAIAKISDFQVPKMPKTTFSIGRLGGGTSINSIAYEAWMEVDMRSVDPKELDILDAKFQQALDEALSEEKRRWSERGELTVERNQVGDRPAGRTEETSEIVQTAISVTKALGFNPRLGAGSTDSNIPMSLGIPAITIGGGGRGSGGHSIRESYDSTLSWQGTQRALLLAIALAQ